MASFSVPLSGLQDSSSELDVIGNNLANLNTDGYKSQSLTFGDIFSQLQATSGNGDPIQVGAGVQIDGTISDLSNGSVDSTGVASNLALQGNGYFVLNNNGVTSYTRDGDFSVNSSGQLTTADGQLVVGFPAVNGTVSSSGVLGPISVNSNGTIPAAATSSFQTDVNLDSAATVGTTFNTPLTVYDSLGTAQTLNIQYTNTGTNTWNYSITLPGAASGAASATNSATSAGDGLTAGNALTAGSVTTIADSSTGQTFSFTATAGETVQDLVNAIDGAAGTTLSAGTTASVNASGQLAVSTTTAGDTLQVSSNDSVLGGFNPVISSGTLSFNSDGQLTSPSGSVTGINIAGLTDGASNLSLTWNLGGSTGSPTITQENSASATTTTTQNGFAVGTLTGYSVLSN